MIKVNGVDIPTPSYYKPYPTLREDTTENSVGDLIRKIISNRWKLEMKWDYLTKEQYATLTDIKFLKEFECIFPNTKGIFVKKKMYGGDLSGEANKADRNGIVRDWVNITFNFIQTKADKYTGGAY